MKKKQSYNIEDIYQKVIYFEVDQKFLGLTPPHLFNINIISKKLFNFTILKKLNN